MRLELLAIFVRNYCFTLKLSWQSGRARGVGAWGLVLCLCRGQTWSLTATVCQPESRTESEHFHLNPLSVALPSLLGTLRASVWLWSLELRQLSGCVVVLCHVSWVIFTRPAIIKVPTFPHPFWHHVPELVILWLWGKFTLLNCLLP